MTDAKRKTAAAHLYWVHQTVAFEQGEHPDEWDSCYSLGAEALWRITALEARAEAADAKLGKAVGAIETMQAQAGGTPNHPYCAMVIETGKDALARLRDGDA